jgi:DNA-binding LacI/PurR family transcriptional regulator
MSEPKPNTVNMADVARQAGVSVSTVSRVLAGASGVSEATRQRISAIARDLSYVVSPNASRLASGSTKQVVVVVPETETWFYYAILGSMEPVLRAAGLDLLLYRLTGTADRTTFFAQLPARRKVDAVVLVGLPLSLAHLERLDTMGLPIIMVGSLIDGYPCVRVDELTVARQAVQHLLRMDHSRIGMICIVDKEGESWQPGVGRESGYRETLANAGVEFDPDLEVQVNFSVDGGARAMDQLLSLERPPTAVFAFSDEIAIGAMRSLKRAGISIPAKISIVGVDDHPMAELSDLTTVRQPVHEMGAMAAKLVVDILDGKPVAPVITLPTHLVVRGSTAPPP